MKEPVSRGDVIELRIGTIAHGGHFIAHWGGRTFFVRHGIPGELVRAQVTDVTSKISRADAIEILEPSPLRVPVECAGASIPRVDPECIATGHPRSCLQTNAFSECPRSPMRPLSKPKIRSLQCKPAMERSR